MHSPLAYLFPQLPGDLGSIPLGLPKRNAQPSRDIKSLHDDISTLTITLADWQGAAKVAFIDSKNKELPELIRWSDGTLQAADALKNYYFKLEEAKQKVDAIRGQADDLWDDFQPLSFLNNKARWEEYKKKLAELGFLYSIVKGSLSKEALNTAASLREALYFTPEDHQQIDIDNDGDKDDVDLGDTRMMSQQELEDIHKRLKDPSKPLFNIDQGHIGDCHLLSTLNAYNQDRGGPQIPGEPGHAALQRTRKDRRVLRGFPGIREKRKARIRPGRHAVWRHSRENAQGGSRFRLRESLHSVPRWRNEEHVPPRRSVGELLSNHHAENLRHSGDPSRER